jgi:hypothetical protein
MEKHEHGIEKQVEAENERQPWKTPAVEVIGQVSGTENVGWSGEYDGAMYTDS